MPHLIESLCFRLHKLSWTMIVFFFPGACGSILLALSPDAVPSTRYEHRRHDICPNSSIESGRDSIHLRRYSAVRICIIPYFDCLPWELKTVVYISSMGPIGDAVSSDRSEQAHCVA